MGILCFVLLGSTIVLMRRVEFAAADGSFIERDTSGYMDEVIRYGTIATLFWGIVGFLVGVVIAAQPCLARAQHRTLSELRKTTATTHISGYIRLWRKCAYLYQFLCRPNEPAVPDCSAVTWRGLSSGDTSFSSCLRRPAISLALRSPKNMQSLNGMWISG